MQLTFKIQKGIAFFLKRVRTACIWVRTTAQGRACKILLTDERRLKIKICDQFLIRVYALVLCLKERPKGSFIWFFNTTVSMP